MHVLFLLPPVATQRASSCCRRRDLPVFQQVELRLSDLLAEGQRLVAEQDAVNSLKLSEEYLKDTGGGGGSLIGLMG
jgi:hypothetical protein